MLCAKGPSNSSGSTDKISIFNMLYFLFHKTFNIPALFFGRPSYFTQTLSGLIRSSLVSNVVQLFGWCLIFIIQDSLRVLNSFSNKPVTLITHLRASVFTSYTSPRFTTLAAFTLSPLHFTLPLLQASPLASRFKQTNSPEVFINTKLFFTCCLHKTGESKEWFLCLCKN